MGLLNSALQIGRSAIQSYQGALQVVGNNISNAANPDHTRVSASFDPLQGPLVTSTIQSGAGVTLSNIRRNLDEALEGRVRNAIGAQESAAQQRSALSRVETIFDEFSGAGTSKRFADFFQSFDTLRNTPEDSAVRDLAIASASELAQSLKGMRSQLAGVSEDLDSEITGLVGVVNDLSGRIGQLNEQISSLEAGSKVQATALRDKRDSLLRELSKVIDVEVREQPNGAINVYAGSEALVQGSSVRELEAVDTTINNLIRTAVRFADTQGDLQMNGGRLGGLIASRDGEALARIADLDTLAANLIAEVNNIHANGQGMVGFKEIIGSSDLLSSTAPLDSAEAGLSVAPQSGSFFITVSDDATKTPKAFRIDIDLGNAEVPTTLESLAASITDQVDGVSASVTSDQRLAITADAGQSYVFGFDGQQAREDTSNVLAALGINTLFTGSSAKDIAVNQTLVGSPLLLSSASRFLPGDGAAAGKIAELDVALLDRFSGQSVTSSYASIVNAVAVASGAATNADESTSTILSALKIQKESISGVSLDEEAISLVKFERAFQGASRYVSAVDDMLSELILLIR